MTRRALVVVGLAPTVLGAVVLVSAVQRDAASVAASMGPAPRGTTSLVPTPVPEPRKSPVRATTPSPTPAATPAAPGRTTPTPSGFRIRIASIGLDHRMTARGLSSDGTIDPPKGSVMWFTGYDRVRPGAVGTAVIAGHVASGSRRDVFAKLSDVDVGDAVQVIEADGARRSYTVTRAGAIDKQKLTTDQAVWGVNTTRSRLAIITCDDAFGFRSDGHRVANFVVIAERS